MLDNSIKLLVYLFVIFLIIFFNTDGTNNPKTKLSVLVCE